jgi:hypothetical protein
MTLSQRIALVALLAGLGQAIAQAPDADLSAKLKRAADLQAQLGQMLVEMATLKDALCPGFKQYLPKADSTYGQWTWDCQFSDGSLYYQVSDANKHRVALVQFFYHPNGVDPKTRGMHAKCNDLPAMRIQDTRVWLLVGKLEMRVEPKDKSLQNDAALDAFVKAFDLAGLAKL